MPFNTPLTLTTMTFAEDLVASTEDRGDLKNLYHLTGRTVGCLTQKPLGELTAEEEELLERASALLSSIETKVLELDAEEAGISYMKASRPLLSDHHITALSKRNE